MCQRAFTVQKTLPEHRWPASSPTPFMALILGKKIQKIFIIKLNMQSSQEDIAINGLWTEPERLENFGDKEANYFQYGRPFRFNKEDQKQEPEKFLISSFLVLTLINCYNAERFKEKLPAGTTIETIHHSNYRRNVQYPNSFSCL